MPKSIMERHRPKVDPPTEKSLAAAYKFQCTEREKAGIKLDPMPANVKPSALYQPFMPTAEQIAILEATDGIYALIVQHGAHTVNAWVHGWLLTPVPPAGLVHLIEQYDVETVARWVRTLAPIAGQEVS
jgi:hypothetical protein